MEEALQHRIVSRTNRLLAITYVALVFQTVLMTGAFLMLNYFSALEVHSSGFAGCIRGTETRWPEVSKLDVEREVFTVFTDVFSDPEVRKSMGVEGRNIDGRLSALVDAILEEQKVKEPLTAPTKENRIKFCEKAWPKPRFFGV